MNTMMKYENDIRLMSDNLKKEKRLLSVIEKGGF